MKLGVNIDHIAYLRELRKINEPEPLEALTYLKRGGADSVVIHLREDRRHINDLDVVRIIQTSTIPVNLECSINPQIIDLVCQLRPFRATLVPEKREEVTTEGGLDLAKNFNNIKSVINELKKHDIEVSLFIDPTKDMIDLSKELESEIIELHTGKYSNISLMLNSNLKLSPHFIRELDLPNRELKILLQDSLNEIKDAVKLANSYNILVAAGHGLNYQNVKDISKIDGIFELNIGQSIIARSVFVGLESAIKEMKCII